MITIQPIRQTSGKKRGFAQNAPPKKGSGEGFAALLQHYATPAAPPKARDGFSPQRHLSPGEENEIDRLRRQILRTNYEVLSWLYRAP